MLKARLVINVDIDNSDNKTGSINIYSYHASFTVEPGVNTTISQYTVEVYPNVINHSNPADLHLTQQTENEGSGE